MSAETIPTRPTHKTIHALLWGAQGLAAVALFGSGTAKLVGAPIMVQVFQAIGLGQWFRYVTGVLEVIGAVALLIPAYSGAGGLLLACVMVGAVCAHLFKIGGNPIHAAALLILVSFVAWGRRDATLRLLKREPLASSKTKFEP